jgi:hypothetical protein
VLHRRDQQLDASETRQGWDIVAVVKRKIVFSKRPMPVVGDVPTLE